MARHSRLEVLTALQRSGFLPIFFHADSAVSCKVMAACAEGGASLFEFTNRGDTALKTFIELDETCKKDHPRMILGAGSILEPHTAALYIQHGAQFIVSPAFNPEVAKLCNRRKVAYIPGCATATEISEAEEHGCEFIKLFPARELGGPDYLKALRGPMPWISAVATGGVEADAEELQAWFKAGAVAVGLGSSLASKENLDKQDYSAIASATRDIVAAIAAARK